MLKQTLNKGISTPIAIGIVLVLALLVGGIAYWYYSETGKKEIEWAEIEIPEKKCSNENPNLCNKDCSLDEDCKFTCGCGAINKNEVCHDEGIMYGCVDREIRCENNICVTGDEKIKKPEIVQEYTCNSNQDCAKKTGQCELECLHKDQEAEIDPEIECEWLPWYSKERCECINNRCVKVTCENLGLDYITCDTETEKDECYLDSDCNNNYWCWKGICSPPIPGETNNCERNICIRTCNTNKDCEEGKSWCKFINLFEGGDVSVGLRRGCVGPDFYYAID